MPTPYEIPLSPQAQTFTVTLAGAAYRGRLVWNSASACWVLDIDDELGAPLAHGVPVVTGVDLLGQLEHLGIGGGLLALTDVAPDEVPTYENLGGTGHLYFVAYD